MDADADGSKLLVLVPAFGNALALLDPALSDSALVNESCKLEPVGVLALSKSTTNAAGFYKGRVAPSSALKNPFCKCITARTWRSLNMCLAGSLLPSLLPSSLT